uniref:non-specific serine/threonine protein kinase n=1 Tax=Chelonoidis abingdonii TaxID=106734 RepID=A0A8C0IWY0_CHEAB
CAHLLCCCGEGAWLSLACHPLPQQPVLGFSYVDLVEGLQDGRFYALKRILCHDKEDRREALHEVEMHGLFEHPNILRLEAHCMVEKGPKHEAWLLLPFLRRGTLWSEVEALRDKGTFLPEERIVLILLGICRGLEAIHAKGYAHRDLKPTNVLLDDEEQPVLMDLLASLRHGASTMANRGRGQRWGCCSQVLEGQRQGLPGWGGAIPARPRAPSRTALCYSTSSRKG